MNKKINKSVISTIGLIIFEKSFRSKGLGKAIVWSSVELVSRCLNLKIFGAGMKIDNIASYKSFLSVGFEKVNTDGKYNYLLLNSNFLIKPINIHIKRVNIDV